MKQFYKEIVLFSWLLLIPAIFDSYSFCDGIIASGKLCHYEYFLITKLFVKTKEMSVKKYAFLLRTIVANFYRKCGFLKIDLEELEQIKMIENLCFV